MIKKLQRKFVLIAMGSLFLVIAALIGTVNIVNLYQIGKKADSLLSLLSAPAPASAPSIMDKPELLSTGAGPAFCIHVTAGEEDDHGKA